ncbi:hypothetical protein Mal15_24980 [Stieleria maiorica]|uniref:Uncharacterized protein n=1 Tax=Stieleria maiorica TaxID=2795974 RepID=A0A5B9MDY8_9BACT|nr:hypothetical protein [Stieleria maiorica]QEF98446.1 hypothetical protein Mal15_24980 [Stieleria maiorica]
MSAQPSPSRGTYTRYRDDDDASRGAQGRPQGQKGLTPTQNQQLLQEVLGETLVRNQENSQQLLETLRRFRIRHQDHAIDPGLFVLIAKAVLKHRLGVRSRQLPAELYDEVGGALWSNEQSRRRIERLWNSLGAES